MKRQKISLCCPSSNTSSAMMTANIDVFYFLTNVMYIMNGIIQYIKLLETSPDIISVNIDGVCWEVASDSPVGGLRLQMTHLLVRHSEKVPIGGVWIHRIICYQR